MAPEQHSRTVAKTRRLRQRSNFGRDFAACRDSRDSLGLDHGQSSHHAPAAATRLPAAATKLAALAALVATIALPKTAVLAAAALPVAAAAVLLMTSTTRPVIPLGRR